MNLKRNFNLLLFFKRKDKVSIPTIEHAFNIPYQTVDSIFKRWIDEGLVERGEVTPKQLGGVRYMYNLTSKGNAFLEDIISLFSRETSRVNGEQESQNGYSEGTPSDPTERGEMILEIANQLVLEIPEFLQDVGISFSEESYRKFVSKVRRFFLERGLNVEWVISFTYPFF